MWSTSEIKIRTIFNLTAEFLSEHEEGIQNLRKHGKHLFFLCRVIKMKKATWFLPWRLTVYRIFYIFLYRIPQCILIDNIRSLAHRFPKISWNCKLNKYVDLIRRPTTGLLRKNVNVSICRQSGHSCRIWSNHESECSFEVGRTESLRNIPSARHQSTCHIHQGTRTVGQWVPSTFLRRNHIWTKRLWNSDEADLH